MSPPTQYKLYGRWILRSKDPTNKQYQSTEAKSIKEKSDNANTKIHNNRQKGYK